MQLVHVIVLCMLYVCVYVCLCVCVCVCVRAHVRVWTRLLRGLVKLRACSAETILDRHQSELVAWKTGYILRSPVTMLACIVIADVRRTPGFLLI